MYTQEERVNMLKTLLGRAKGCLGISPIGNLTLNEITALIVIHDGCAEKGSFLTMSEAGDLLKLGRSAMSQLVGRLERKGMLKREIVLWDRRKTTVRLTEKGEDVVKRLQDRQLDNLQRAIDIFGEHTDLFIRLLTEYLDETEKKNNA